MMFNGKPLDGYDLATLLFVAFGISCWYREVVVAFLWLRKQRRD